MMDEDSLQAWAKELDQAQREVAFRETQLSHARETLMATKKEFRIKMQECGLLRYVHE